MLDGVGAKHAFKLVAPEEAFVGPGDGLDVMIKSYRAGDVADDKHIVGEEVAAAISGRFDVEVIGDETYRVDAGTAIIIPRGPVRRWRCLAPGLLFRTATRAAVSSDHPYARFAAR